MRRAGPVPTRFFRTHPPALSMTRGTCLLRDHLSVMRCKLGAGASGRKPRKASVGSARHAWLCGWRRGRGRGAAAAAVRVMATGERPSPGNGALSVTGPRILSQSDHPLGRLHACSATYRQRLAMNGGFYEVARIGTCGIY